jgi:hypothetical protein
MSSENSTDTPKYPLYKNPLPVKQEYAKQSSLQELNAEMKSMQIDSSYLAQYKHTETNEQINSASLLDMDIVEACRRKTDCQMVESQLLLLSSDDIDAFLYKVVL